jgi:hypothetical protein
MSSHGLYYAVLCTTTLSDKPVSRARLRHECASNGRKYLIWLDGLGGHTICYGSSLRNSIMYNTIGVISGFFGSTGDNCVLGICQEASCYSNSWHCFPSGPSCQDNFRRAFTSASSCLECWTDISWSCR